MDYAFVALFDGTPVAVAHTKEDMEMLLAEYTQGSLVEYKPYNSKYPSINEYEGSYYYDEALTNEVLEFKIYTVDYLGKDEKDKN